MFQHTNKQNQVVVFKQYTHKKFSVFASLKREIRIGVLSVSTLLTATINETMAQVQMDKSVETDREHQTDEVVIAGSLAPLTALQSARMVSVLTRQEIEQAAAQSVNDLLKLASGVDVRQRGSFGIQTDICLQGGTFDQLTLLVNGTPFNTPQTGHLSADFPFGIEDIERIEILEGAASRVYGGFAFGGAINIVTRQGDRNQTGIHATGGSYGSWGGDAYVSHTTGPVGGHISGGYEQSDGGTENSEFRKSRIYYQGRYDGRDTRINWQTGFSRKKYGANTFYSAAYPNQYEENDRYFVSVSAETKGRVRFLPSAYWQRATDHFELTKNSSAGENFHRTDVFGASVRSHFDWAAGRTAAGIEIRNEGILSTNLGRPFEEGKEVAIPGEKDKVYSRHENRTNVNYSIEHNVLLRHFSLSAGVTAQMNTAVDHKHRWYPGIDMAYIPCPAWRIYASWNMGIRIPTYTELFYKSPTQEGNTGLKPEESQSYSLGTRYRHKGFTMEAKGFYNRGRHMIDWVMYTADDIYHSTGFNLDNYGAQVSAATDFRLLLGNQCFLDRLNVGYTYIHQKRHDNQDIYKSCYALEYLRHKVTANLSHRIWKQLSASWDFRWQDRMGSYLLYEQGKNTNRPVPYSPYATLDIKVQWVKPHYSLYVTACNVTNHVYYDLGNIPQPGIWVMAGGRRNISF